MEAYRFTLYQFSILGMKFNDNRVASAISKDYFPTQNLVWQLGAGQHHTDGLEFGHCGRWHLDAPTADMESSPVIGAEIMSNGRFLATRLRALDPEKTFHYEL